MLKLYFTKDKNNILQIHQKDENGHVYQYCCIEIISNHFKIVRGLIPKGFRKIDICNLKDILKSSPINEQPEDFKIPSKYFYREFNV